MKLLIENNELDKTKDPIFYFDHLPPEIQEIILLECLIDNQFNFTMLLLDKKHYREIATLIRTFLFQCFFPEEIDKASYLSTIKLRKLFERLIHASIAIENRHLAYIYAVIKSGKRSEYFHRQFTTFFKRDLAEVRSMLGDDDSIKKLKLPLLAGEYSKDSATVATLTTYFPTSTTDLISAYLRGGKLEELATHTVDELCVNPALEYSRLNVCEYYFEFLLKSANNHPGVLALLPDLCGILIDSAIQSNQLKSLEWIHKKILQFRLIDHSNYLILLSKKIDGSIKIRNWKIFLFLYFYTNTSIVLNVAAVLKALMHAAPNHMMLCVDSVLVKRKGNTYKTGYESFHQNKQFFKCELTQLAFSRPTFSAEVDWGIYKEYKKRRSPIALIEELSPFIRPIYDAQPDKSEKITYQFNYDDFKIHAIFYRYIFAYFKQHNLQESALTIVAYMERACYYAAIKLLEELGNQWSLVGLVTSIMPFFSKPSSDIKSFPKLSLLISQHLKRLTAATEDFSLASLLGDIKDLLITRNLLISAEDEVIKAIYVIQEITDVYVIDADRINEIIQEKDTEENGNDAKFFI